MATEKFANNFASTLNGAIDNSQVTLVVASASGAPAVQFRIIIDAEIMIVTGVAATTFTVTRGAEGTSAASHANSAAVTHVYTAGAMDQRLADAVQTGTDAALPANEKAGRMYFDSDSFYFSRDTGAAWVAFGPVFPLTKPVSGNFAWFNQGGATIATTSGGIYLAGPAQASDNMRGMVMTAPSTPYTITAMMVPLFDASNYCATGLCFSDGTKYHNFAFAYDNGGGGPPTLNTSGLTLQSTKFTNVTTFSAHYKNLFHPSGYGAFPRFLRIADDGSNRICSLSNDGINFLTFHTVGRTDFLTANKVGFFVNNTNSVATGLMLMSWLQG